MEVFWADTSGAVQEEPVLSWDPCWTQQPPEGFSALPRDAELSGSPMVGLLAAACARSGFRVWALRGSLCLCFELAPQPFQESGLAQATGFSPFLCFLVGRR